MYEGYSINRRMAIELRDAFRRVREDRSVGVVAPDVQAMMDQFRQKVKS